MELVSKLIRYFLWRRGKGNQTKFHLVIWEIVKRPILEGELQIRDPSLANISMGGKSFENYFQFTTIHLAKHFGKNI